MVKNLPMIEHSPTYMQMGAFVFTNITKCKSTPNKITWGLKDHG
jgi:hypothetical protein